MNVRYIGLRARLAVHMPLRGSREHGQLRKTVSTQGKQKRADKNDDIDLVDALQRARQACAGNQYSDEVVYPGRCGDGKL